MKHVIFGGDGFVGRYLAKDLMERGEEVLVVDVVKSNFPHYGKVRFVEADITDSAQVADVSIGADDIVYNLAAKMLSPIQKRIDRYPFFYPVNTFGAGNIMAAAARAECSKLVQFTTDMVYGHTIREPQVEDHPIAPLGHYGASKAEAERITDHWRERGMDITVIRPRLIIGPGRLGILEKLFKLIDHSLPVPMIGSGKGPYQFISVYDCAQAARLAGERGCPNRAFHLGSDNPPSVRELLGGLIRSAGSKSLLIPTPAPLVKATLSAFDAINLPILDPEQYLIADEVCVRDTTAAKTELGWTPMHNDSDMLNAAYAEYRDKKAGLQSGANALASMPAE